MRATFGHPAVIGTGTTAINVGSLPTQPDTGGDMAVPHPHPHPPQPQQQDMNVDEEKDDEGKGQA